MKITWLLIYYENTIGINVLKIAQLYQIPLLCIYRKRDRSLLWIKQQGILTSGIWLTCYLDKLLAAC
ncbi:hypothetical protein L9F63_013023, partial [Diploptera punctata]